MTTPPSLADELVRNQDPDGMKWAQAFAATVEKNPDVATDVGTLVCWFANAIEVGRSVGQQAEANNYERGLRDGAQRMLS